MPQTLVEGWRFWACTGVHLPVAKRPRPQPAAVPVIVVVADDDEQTAWEAADSLQQDSVGLRWAEFNASTAAAADGSVQPAVLADMRQRLESGQSLVLWGKPDATMRGAVFGLSYDVPSWKWALTVGEALSPDGAGGGLAAGTCHKCVVRKGSRLAHGCTRHSCSPAFQQFAADAAAQAVDRLQAVRGPVA